MLAQFTEAARERGLWQGGKMAAADIFRLVRDMPYRRAADTLPETILSAWRGTCSGKHYLLQALFIELGWRVDIIHASHWLFPKPGEATLALGPVPDVHTFLSVKEPEPMTVDATWPMGAQRLGLVVNERLIPFQNQRLACVPECIWMVPPGADADALKRRLVRMVCGPRLAARERLIAALQEHLQGV